MMYHFAFPIYTSLYICWCSQKAQESYISYTKLKLRINRRQLPLMSNELAQTKITVDNA